ncbi:MAG: T9SS type A sorting domain-containing protein [Dysgonamonadaceae bacterium]|jgi:hypothetical protein|nr:T9SS type A sorting domain-containing protein [Dysgonamonadaceae bacterium]
MKELILFLAILFFPVYLQAQAPMYSDETNEYWYYIQFNYNGYVIQSEGEDKVLTVQIPVAGNDAQLWKVEQSTATYMDEYAGFYTVNIYNKANPLLAIRYLTKDELPGVSSRFFATQREGAYITGTDDDKNNPILVTNYLDEMVALNARNINYFMRPLTDEVGAQVYRDGDNNPNREKCALKFVLPENMPLGINAAKAPVAKIRIVSDLESKRLSVELPEGVKSMVVINAVGKTVKNIKPSGNKEQIDLSGWTSGIYILKVEKSTGVETAKFVVR